MLACVSSLAAPLSYNEVITNKDWLTTSETISYIYNNCPALESLLAVQNKTRRKAYTKLYNWSQKTASIWNDRPYLDSVLVYDNGRRAVRFWYKPALDSEEQKMKKSIVMFAKSNPAWFSVLESLYQNTGRIVTKAVVDTI